MPTEGESNTTPTATTNGAPNPSHRGPHRRHRRIFVYGYLIERNAVYERCVEDGTDVKDHNPRHSTYGSFISRLLKECKISYNTFQPVVWRIGRRPLAVVLAYSYRPRTSGIHVDADKVQALKKFLRTEDEPEWFVLAEDML